VSTYFAKPFRSPQAGRVARLILHHLSADTANG
jgi:hypothetical protein